MLRVVMDPGIYVLQEGCTAKQSGPSKGLLLGIMLERERPVPSHPPPPLVMGGRGEVHVTIATVVVSYIRKERD